MNFNKEIKSFTKQFPQVVELAQTLGKQGFEKGIKAPCLCSGCMDLIEQYQNIQGASLAILGAWDSGYKNEHLKLWNASISELKASLQA